jgi:hypothetical protein
MQTDKSEFAQSTANTPKGCNVDSLETEFFGIEEACRWSNIGRTNIFALIKAGRIRSINLRQPGRAKGRRLIHVPSLRAYLLAHAEGGQ